MRERWRKREGEREREIGHTRGKIDCAKEIWGGVCVCVCSGW